LTCLYKTPNDTFVLETEALPRGSRDGGVEVGLSKSVVALIIWAGMDSLPDGRRAVRQAGF
jgi:hypothetical protein